jgi:hypothetical protein
LMLPAVAMSVAVMAAVNCELFTKVVAFGVALKLTTAPCTKEPALPFTVNVNGPPPASVLVGDSEASTGCTLLMLNCSAGVEVPPPGAGVVTVTFTVPAVAISAAVMAAVSCVADLNVVA